MPFSTKRGRSGGKASHLYDKRTCLEWLRDHGSAKISQRARQELERMDGGKPSREGGAAGIGGPKRASTPLPAAASGAWEVGLDAAIRRMEAKDARWGFKRSC